MLLKVTPLKTFLAENCIHLLKPLEGTGTTSIPKSMASVDILSALPNSVKLGEGYNNKLIADLKGKAGVYVFFSEGEEVVSQCGSNLSFGTRLQQHYTFSCYK